MTDHPGKQALADILAGENFTPADFIAIAEYVDTKDAEIARLKSVNERDRSQVAEALAAIIAAIRSREWLVEGRGSYEWDDDRYQSEFGQALEEIRKAAATLSPLASNWSDCPLQFDEIIRARTDWQSKAEGLEAENARLREALRMPVELLENNPNADWWELWESWVQHPAGYKAARTALSTKTGEADG